MFIESAVTDGFELRPDAGRRWPSATWPRAPGTTARSGEFLRDALLRGPDAALPDLVADATRTSGTVGEVYEESLRVAGGLRALGLGPGDVVAFQLPNWVEAAITFYACTMLGVTLVPIVHFYGPKEVGFILRQSRARALVIVSRIGQRDYLAELATVRDGLHDLEHVVVVGDTRTTRPATSPLRRPARRRAHRRAGARRPGRRRRSSATPRAPPPTPRAWCTPTARSAARCASCPDHQAKRDRPSLVGAPVGHAIGMLGGLLCPLVGGRPDLHDRRLGPADRPRRHGRGADRRRQRLDLLLHQPARLPRASGPSTSS